MALGDGSGWDETNPQQSTLANTLDSYDRDVRIGVRGRMALEHEWPSSQSVTSAAGQHKFITLQNQAAKPTVSGTQLAAIYTKTVGAGLQELFYENELGTEVQVSSRGQVNFSTNAFSAQLAKAWAYWNPNTAAGSFTPLANYNVAGMSKSATGSWVITLSAPLTSSQYVVVGNAGSASIGASGNFAPHAFALSTGQFSLGISNSADAPSDSPTFGFIIVHGN